MTMDNIPRRLIKGCAFDLGNTLINDQKLTAASVKDLGQWLGRKAIISSPSRFIQTYMQNNYQINRPFISHTFGEIDFFEKTLAELSISHISAEEILQKYRRILTDKIQPDQDIIETFQYLKAQKIQIALISNESNCRVEATLDKIGLQHFFDTIIVSEDIGVEKPDPRIFMEGLNRLNIASDAMIMFGDNNIADGACKELGIYFVLVTGFRSTKWVWEKGNSYQPDYVMPKISRNEMETFMTSFQVSGS